MIVVRLCGLIQEKPNHLGVLVIGESEAESLPAQGQPLRPATAIPLLDSVDVHSLADAELHALIVMAVRGIVIMPVSLLCLMFWLRPKAYLYLCAGLGVSRRGPVTAALCHLLPAVCQELPIFNRAHNLALKALCKPLK